MDVLVCDPTQEDDGDLVVFDRMLYAVAARFRNTGPDACAAIASAMRRSSPARAVVYGNGPLRSAIEAPLGCGIVARATCNLHGHDIEDGFVLTGGSTIEMNLHAVLREKHGIPNSVVGLDRKRNFTKPTAECDESDVTLQLEAIWAVVDRLRELIHAALPGCDEVESKISLRSAEVCHDVACENAEAVARATPKVPVSGSRLSWQKEYECTTGNGRAPTWHFARPKRGPVQKGYVKAEGLLRTETSCLTRNAVAACVGDRTNAPFSGEGAVALALEFYHPAGELCCQALDHVRAVAAGNRSQVELRQELGALHTIAEGRREANGYTPNSKAQQAANRLLNQLYDGGIAHAVGLRRRTKVRDALERLVRPGGPLVRGATLGIFCVAPEFGLGGHDGRDPDDPYFEK